MNRKVYLLGELGEKFGKEWEMDVSSVADAMRLINCQVDGFTSYLMQAMEAHVEAGVVVGSDIINDEREIFLNLEKGDIVISLIPSGARKGWGRILAAIFIAVFAWQFGPEASSLLGAGGMGPPEAALLSAGAQQTLYTVAANLALSGITQLMTKLPSTKEEEAESNIFNGPTNTVKQGVPIPILYGQLLVGGTPMSISFDIETGEKSSGSYNLDTGTSGGSKNAGENDTGKYHK